MIYIENIFVCMAAPLLVTAFYLNRKNVPILLFVIAGMGACLLSAYLNTFFAAALSLDDFHAVVEIAPVVEEIMKFLPLIFYCFVFEPKPEKIRTAVLMVAAGFATFENICYLLQHGSAELHLLLIRGFSTGAMHIICGGIVGYGLVYVWQREGLRLAGSCGLLSAAIIFHAVYNLMAAHGGIAAYIAYMLPLCTLIASILIPRFFPKAF